MSIHPIEITEMTIFPVRNRSEGNPLQAFVRIVLNNAIVINGLRVINGKFGQFVAYPREKGKNLTLCFPIRKDLHEDLSRTILNEYRLILSNSTNEKEEGAG